jgi:hypothetical protein
VNGLFFRTLDLPIGFVYSVDSNRSFKDDAPSSQAMAQLGLDPNNEDGLSADFDSKRAKQYGLVAGQVVKRLPKGEDAAAIKPGKQGGSKHPFRVGRHPLG